MTFRQVLCPTARAQADRAIFGRGFLCFKGLPHRFRATRVRLLHRRSKAAGCGLAVDDPGGAFFGRGFNAFKPLRRHFRATRDDASAADRSPIALHRESVASLRDARGRRTTPGRQPMKIRRRRGFPVLAAAPGSARNNREDMLLMKSAPRSVIFPRSVAAATKDQLSTTLDLYHGFSLGPEYCSLSVRRALCRSRSALRETQSLRFRR